jgi:hypothetical protein
MAAVSTHAMELDEGGKDDCKFVQWICSLFSATLEDVFEENHHAGVGEIFVDLRDHFILTFIWERAKKNNLECNTKVQVFVSTTISINRDVVGTFARNARPTILPASRTQAGRSVDDAMKIQPCVRATDANAKSPPSCGKWNCGTGDRSSYAVLRVEKGNCEINLEFEKETKRRHISFHLAFLPPHHLLVEIQMHLPPTQQRTVLVNALPPVRVHAGLPRRQNPRPRPLHNHILVPV